LQPEPILQSRFMDPPWTIKSGGRLPGTGPIAPMDWMRWDDAFGGQMALRDRLIVDQTEAVHALRPSAMAAARELLDSVLVILAARSDYAVTADAVTRPDDVTVALNRDVPLLTLGRLVQEDFCILHDQGDAHVMTGAILCFPASWSLDEKIGRPLIGIHKTVEEYDENLAKRVQRLFDAIRVGQPMMRANCLLYRDADLFQPRREDNRREQMVSQAQFVRTERQCLLRLPQTRAVVFTIHTTVVLRADLDSADLAALEGHLGLKAPT